MVKLKARVLTKNAIGNLNAQNRQDLIVSVGPARLPSAESKLEMFHVKHIGSKAWNKHRSDQCITITLKSRRPPQKATTDRALRILSKTKYWRIEESVSYQN